MFRMNFPLVLLCGLILSCFCSRVAGLDEKISVIQSPDNIIVNEGESAEITCCWTQMTKEISNVQVVWLKDETKVSAENRLYQTSPSQNCSTLNIANITSKDAGEYVCKVNKDITVLTEDRGNKTILRVNKEQQWTKATTTKVVPVNIWVPKPIAGLDEKISVIQSPDNIIVNEGESAEITCCWTQMTKEISNVKVVWLKDDTKVSAEKRLYQTSPSQNCFTLHIAHISPNDAGEYVCKVTKDIPVLTEGRGNKTILTVIKMYVTTEDEKPLVIDNPKTNPKDETSLDGHFVDSSNESSDLWDIVLIYIFRCLPFISLLVAFFSLNRDGRRAIPSKPVEQPEEDLESGNKRRNDAEDVKQDERDSVEEEERDTTEKLKTAEDEKDKQEEEKDPVVFLNTEDEIGYNW